MKPEIVVSCWKCSFYFLGDWGSTHRLDCVILRSNLRVDRDEIGDDCVAVERARSLVQKRSQRAEADKRVNRTAAKDNLAAGIWCTVDG